MSRTGKYSWNRSDQVVEPCKLRDRFRSTSFERQAEIGHSRDKKMSKHV